MVRGAESSAAFVALAESNTARMVCEAILGEWEDCGFGADLKSRSSTGSFRWLMKVQMEPNFDWSSERMARDSKRVVVGGAMRRRTWRAKTEVLETSFDIFCWKSAFPGNEFGAAHDLESVNSQLNNFASL